MAQYKYDTKGGTKWLAKFRYKDAKTGEVKVEYKRGFLTKREAKAYEEEFLDKVSFGQPEEEIRKVRTFGDVYDEYMASHKREDMKLSTLRTKENIFAKHIFPYFKDKPILSITDDDIHSWQQKMKTIKMDNGKCFSQAFLRTIQSQFNTIINYANSKGYLKLNPLADIKNMGTKDKRVEVWTKEEYEKFAFEAMKYPEYYYCYEVLYWCGLREGELLALTPADIDFEAKVIHIEKTYAVIDGHEFITTPKTESSKRVVSMPDFLCEELKEYLSMLYDPQPTKRIFRVNKGSLCKKFHECADAVGLKHIPIHGLRHSHVSLLISRKFDIFEISKRIGHKSVKTTQDTYGHLFTETQRSMADDLNSMRR